jgi:hypothetical protein
MRLSLSRRCDPNRVEDDLRQCLIDAGLSVPDTDSVEGRAIRAIAMDLAASSRRVAGLQPLRCSK